MGAPSVAAARRPSGPTTIRPSRVYCGPCGVCTVRKPGPCSATSVALFVGTNCPTPKSVYVWPSAQPAGQPRQVRIARPVAPTGHGCGLPLGERRDVAFEPDRLGIREVVRDHVLAVLRREHPGGGLVQTVDHDLPPTSPAVAAQSVPFLRPASACAKIGTTGPAYNTGRSAGSSVRRRQASARTRRPSALQSRGVESAPPAAVCSLGTAADSVVVANKSGSCRGIRGLLTCNLPGASLRASELQPAVSRRRATPRLRRRGERQEPS